MKRSKRTASVLATVVATLVSGLTFAGTAHAAGTSYHVDNRSGSNCSDSGPGTQQRPWCTFAPVNARTYTAGDKILLARGAAWAESMDLRGSGTAGNRIELSAYGRGDKPRILKGADHTGIEMFNVSHWSVNNLEIDGSGEGKAKLVFGIRARYDGAEGIGNQDLNFSSLELHHNHMGVYVAGTSTLADGQWAIKGVRMSDIEGSRNEVSIAFGAAGLPRTFLQDVVLSRLNLTNDDGQPAAYKNCPNSLTLQNITRLTVMDSLVSHAGGCYVHSGTTGIYLGNVNDANLTNNIVAYTQQSGSPDQSGVNYENGTSNVALRGNLITGNVRWGVALQGIHEGSPNEDVTVESNAIAYNGQPPIAALGDDAHSDGVIRGNLWEGDSLTAVVNGGSFADVEITGNVGPAVGDRIWFAARDFSPSQGLYGWRYQYSDNGGATWADLTYHQNDQSWRPAGSALPVLEKWNWHPGGSSGHVARTWTAPRDGTVAIRGQAAKSDLGGDGVRVQIQHNGRPVLGSRALGGSDRVGVPTNVDSLTLKAGDTLRFIVDPGAAGANSYDTTSWTPVIGYLN
ncbi:right-handed parallel beta-helix repeat-containing protein [Saccharopolyspora indica]|uniref:right-handed parallel beta-helix repeat-containing protein n=1 Tax=Saccharopolyspora indica TaxID=1229659 RepID=UPI0022EA554F|nr:right-handed parallel beta-helix repeat-containing protein [Saccharopolyspora indica]MDA3648653.1 right-handed parallel beta-helix repeat-containing protein [Saccharopolyspora indica]